jgi:hypothetical protein
VLPTEVVHRRPIDGMQRVALVLVNAIVVGSGAAKHQIAFEFEFEFTEQQFTDERCAIDREKMSAE